MNDIIASRDFRGVGAQGDTFAIAVQIGRPYLLTDTKHETWRCPITIDPIALDLPDIYGSDSWQALWLALTLAHAQLADFLRSGGHLYYPESDDEFTIADFPDTLPRRA